MKPKFCDYCAYEVEKRGKIEPEWVHLHGSVFCMVTVATVNGSHFISVATVNDTHYPKKEKPCFCGMTSPGSLCHTHSEIEKNRKKDG